MPNSNNISTKRKREISNELRERLEGLVTECPIPVPTVVLSEIVELMFPKADEHRYAINAFERFVEQAREKKNEFRTKGAGLEESIYLDGKMRAASSNSSSSNLELVRQAMIDVMRGNCLTRAQIIALVIAKLGGRIPSMTIERCVQLLLFPPQPPFKDCGNGRFTAS